MLLRTNGNPFCTSRTKYEFPDTGASANRIVIPIQVGGLGVAAVLDTAAPYTIFSPQLADALELDPNQGHEVTRMLIRGHWHQGYLCRYDVTLVADEGDDISVDGSIFVSTNSDLWRELPPAFIGQKGCLELIRIALDRMTQDFYFGASE